MKREGTLLLTGREVATLLTIEDCMAAVEHAFNLHGQGKTSAPGILGVHARDGGFHIKAGFLELNRSYFAAKVNANFPHNAKRFGLPMIQGVVALCDGENGYPLALMDSIEITIQRTGAATGIAAKYLARSMFVSLAPRRSNIFWKTISFRQVPLSQPWERTIPKSRN